MSTGCLYLVAAVLFFVAAVFAPGARKGRMRL